MNDRPPIRYDEEGKSLPERGSGRAQLEAAVSSQLDNPPAPAPLVREPEKLVIPPAQVMWLLAKMFQTPEGDAWLRGFVTAHGEPSWIVNNQWGIKAGEADLVRTDRPNGQMR